METTEKSSIDRLNEILLQLTNNQIRYVVEMPNHSSKKECAEEIDVTVDTVYRWPKIVDEAVELMRYNVVEGALAIRKKNLVKAMMVKTSGLDDEEANIRQKAATEIIEWEMGKAQSNIDTIDDVEKTNPLPSIPAEMIAPSFSNVIRAVKSRLFREYLIKGGRGSTKSSFVSLDIIELLVNNPTWHALAMRDQSNTLKRSVYNQLAWAIGELGLSGKFKKIANPLEMTYIPTGQKIYFAGARDPDNIKGIKLEFGYIAIGWFEELDQFAGAEAVRKIEQSFMRGGNEFHVFKTYNPPKSVHNWVNKYSLISKEGMFVHDSDYLSVPVEWLGQPFVDEAEHLKNINEKAYRHEYLGEITGTGGQVLENVVIEEIKDKEIEQFDHILHGLDFGWFPDPTHYLQMYYHEPSLTLYIFGELRRWKTRNEAMYNEIVEYGYNQEDLIIADNVPPQNIADYRAFGAHIRGAEKGAGSRKYRRNWMQSLVSIVVDPVRCPYAAVELPSLEYIQTKDGEFISEVKDGDDHAFDAAGYGTNLIWRRGGE